MRTEKDQKKKKSNSFSVTGQRFFSEPLLVLSSSRQSPICGWLEHERSLHPRSPEEEDTADTLGSISNNAYTYGVAWHELESSDIWHLGLSTQQRGDLVFLLTTSTYFGILSQLTAWRYCSSPRPTRRHSSRMFVVQEESSCWGIKTTYKSIYISIYMFLFLYSWKV